ncbi:MAG: recombinase family protein, partial [Ktedonobacterales bacterium]
MAKNVAANQPERVRVLGYCRVSTQDQGDSGHGLDAQRAAIAHECKCRGWQLVETYVDVASGKTTKKRPELERALTGLDDGTASVLMVAKLDRLARSTLDALTMLERAQRRGWALVALDFGLDATTPAGRMFVTILAAFGQWERELIAERTSKALRTAQSKGVQLGRASGLPAKVRARIVRERNAGKSLAAIAEGLNADDVPTS